MKSLLVYSSLTGNTEAVARAINQAMPAEAFPVKSAPSPRAYDFVCLGFWVHRAGPDPLMRRYMAEIKGRVTAFFGTLAADPNSNQARKVVGQAGECLSGNLIIGHFLCQGRLPPTRMAALLSGAAVNPRHPMTPARAARLMEANLHPNEDDFQKARQVFRELYQTARGLTVGRKPVSPKILKGINSWGK